MIVNSTSHGHIPIKHTALLLNSPLPSFPFLHCLVSDCSFRENIFVCRSGCDWKLFCFSQRIIYNNFSHHHRKDGEALFQRAELSVRALERLHRCWQLNVSLGKCFQIIYLQFIHLRLPLSQQTKQTRASLLKDRQAFPQTVSKQRFALNLSLSVSIVSLQNNEDVSMITQDTHQIITFLGCRLHVPQFCSIGWLNRCSLGLILEI